MTQPRTSDLPPGRLSPELDRITTADLRAAAARYSRDLLDKANALREALGLPVFDIYSLITWLHLGLRPRDFGTPAAAGAARSSVLTAPIFAHHP